MTDNQITALAREYAEELAEEVGVKLDPLNWACSKCEIGAKAVIIWLLRRFCLVEKSKVEEEYKKACESVNKHSATTGCLFFVGQKQTIESLFPDLGKEVKR